MPTKEPSIQFSPKPWPLSPRLAPRRHPGEIWGSPSTGQVQGEGTHSLWQDPVGTLCIWPHFLVSQMVKTLPAMSDTWVRSLGGEESLDKGMATHSSFLAWGIPWTEEPGRLQSIGSQRVRHDWATNTLKRRGTEEVIGLIPMWPAEASETHGGGRIAWGHIWGMAGPESEPRSDLPGSGALSPCCWGGSLWTKLSNPEPKLLYWLPATKIFKPSCIKRSLDLPATSLWNYTHIYGPTQSKEAEADFWTCYMMFLALLSLVSSWRTL